jgi:hypothetical protein
VTRHSGRAATQRIADHLQHTLRLLQHIVVQEADDAIARLRKFSRSLFIIRGLLRVLSAIELYYQSLFHSDKISDVSSQRMLSSEFKFLQAAITQQAPKTQLGVGA